MSPRRAPGRRVAQRPSSRGRGPARGAGRGPDREPRPPARATGRGAGPGPVLALLAIVIVAAGLAWAATAPRLSAPHADSSHTTPIARDFSCDGGLSGATARVGVAGSAGPGLSVDGIAAAKPVIPLGSASVHVNAPAPVAARAYAVRSASGPKKKALWYAAGACPTPRSNWWFVGVGGSQAHRTVLTLADPRRGDAIVAVTVFGPQGVVKAPGLGEIRVPSGRAVHLDLSKVAPALGDLAVRISASRGLVTASAADSWSPDFVQKPVQDWVTPQPRGSDVTTLAGLPAKTARATLLVANPAPVEAVVKVELIGSHGQFAPTSGAVVRVGPRSVTPVSLARLLKASPSAIRLTSQVPLSATVRVGRGTDDAYVPAVGRLAGTSVTGVPVHQGSARLMLIGGPRAGRVRVTPYDAGGRRGRAVTVTLHRSTSTSVPLPARAVAVAVEGHSLSGALVLGEGSPTEVGVLALEATTSQAHVPVVRPVW